MKLLKSIWAWVVWFTPRIVTSQAVFEQDAKGNWVPVCCVEDIQPGEYFQKVGTVRSFEWMFIGLAFQQEHPLRDFRNGGRS